MFKCGFVAVIGKPNAGKSSLVNALVGEKVSIVSPKPQTTRNNILGIYNEDDCQIIFVDTPGINKAGTGLDNFMQKSIKGAVSDVNAVIIVTDITKEFSTSEKQLIDNYFEKKIPVIVVLNKIDLVSEEKVFRTLSTYMPVMDKCEVVPVSSLKHKNLNALIDVVKKYLVEMEDKFYDDESYTDKPLKFLVAEIIREKALYFLSEEIPHGIAVVVQNYEETDTIVNIDADIICEKASHKPIILGHQGEMLKKIGHNARVTIQKIVQKKVMLKIFVKLKSNWKNNLEFLNSMGYNELEI
ncbi:MAG: GTPase Era [Clostridia bacterium]|nr:GTPase Era [Clostridia bacterium]